MPFIKRNDLGEITSIKKEGDATHLDFLPPTHTDIIAFLSGHSASPNNDTAKDALSESDQDFARATEDLIHLLIKKNIILFTELPPAVQNKISGREKLRSNLNDSPYNFLDNSDYL